MLGKIIQSLPTRPSICNTDERCPSLVSKLITTYIRKAMRDRDRLKEKFHTSTIIAIFLFFLIIFFRFLSMPFLSFIFFHLFSWHFFFFSKLHFTRESWWWNLFSTIKTSNGYYSCFLQSWCTRYQRKTLRFTTWAQTKYPFKCPQGISFMNWVDDVNWPP